MPVYFKSRFMSASDPGRDKQLAFEATMAGTWLFESDARQPAWSKVKPRLANLIPDL
jgi:hypothetical protein